MATNVKLMASEEYVDGKVGAKYTKPSGGIPASDLSSAVQASLGKANTALQSHQSLAAYVNGGSYDSTNKKILLKHNSTTIAEIDATAFIKDGMVSSVEIDDGKLVITFNTDAGQEPIEIPLTSIFNPENYYDKDAVDGLLDDKVDVVDGKGLSTEDYTTAEKTKLSGIETGAEVNVIETVKVNGTALSPSGKAVDITVPTGTAASKDVPTSGDASTTQVVMGNDSRLSDARTPTAHKSSHATGGSDAIAPSDIGAAASSHTHAASDITSGLATVATTGSYNNLSDKPTIPAAQVNADWNAASGVAQILNKPTIPTVPTALPNPNALTIGSGNNAVTYDGSASGVALVPGTNVTMTKSGSTVTIDTTGGGGGGITGFTLGSNNGVGYMSTRITLDDSIVIEWGGSVGVYNLVLNGQVFRLPEAYGFTLGYIYPIFLCCSKARFQAVERYDSEFPYISINGVAQLAYKGNVDFTLNFSDASSCIEYVNGTCLAYGTQIALADVGYRAVEDIRVGDRVLALDENGNEVEDVVTECTGEAGLIGAASDIWRFDDGTEVTTVGRHRFYNADLGEFMYLEAWNMGEHARLRDGRLVALVSHERVEGDAKHATLFTKRYNTYFANGMLCGNRRSVKVR